MIDDGATTWGRRYDADGHLVVHDVDDGVTPVVTHQLVDEVAGPYSQVIGQSTDAGTTWTHRLYGPAGPIAETTTTAALGYQLDHRGSVIEDPPNPDIADAPESYDPFGTPDTAVADHHIGYRAEQTTADLVHLRNRDYDPATGQFLTRDPLDGVTGTPTAANPYHYADNDPHNKTDPMGLRAKDGSLLEGQIGAACDSVGGRIVWYGGDGTRACLEPPAGRTEGAQCFPPMTPDGDSIVYHQGACSVRTTEIVCERGAWIPGLNRVCRNGDAIVAGLTVIAIGASGAVIGAAGAMLIGGAAGIVIPTGALAGLGGGTVGGGIVMSPAAAGYLVGSYAGLQQLINLATSAEGSSAPRDYSDKQTKNWSAQFKSERDARAFAREKLGRDPFEAGTNKLRSADGRWQYRAKPNDVADRHIHLEQLDPFTGRVIQNVHLRW